MTSFDRHTPIANLCVYGQRVESTGPTDFPGYDMYWNTERLPTRPMQMRDVTPFVQSRYNRNNLPDGYFRDPNQYLASGGQPFTKSNLGIDNEYFCSGGTVGQYGLNEEYTSDSATQPTQAQSNNSLMYRNLFRTPCYGTFCGSAQQQSADYTPVYYANFNSVDTNNRSQFDLIKNYYVNNGGTPDGAKYGRWSRERMQDCISLDPRADMPNGLYASRGMLDQPRKKSNKNGFSTAPIYTL